MPELAVVVAASNLMPSLRERLPGEGELLTFADTEPIQALQAILEHRPRLIVLERLFAATPRGAALINRIKTDPQLSAAEVRVMSHTGDYMRQLSKPGVPAAAPPEAAVMTAGSSAPARSAVVPAPPEDAPRQLDWHGTRRAPRHRVRSGVEIQLDGNPANVVDLSVAGAQVLSMTILRPNQRVRVSIPTEEFVMRFRGTIAWAKFELPKPTEPPRYRAGVEFNDADAAAMTEFCGKNKA
jgi:CheY-like chemotaxis protein